MTTHLNWYDGIGYCAVGEETSYITKVNFFSEVIWPCIQRLHQGQEHHGYYVEQDQKDFYVYGRTIVPLDVIILKSSVNLHKEIALD